MQERLSFIKSHQLRSQWLFILLLGSLYLPWGINSLFIGIFFLHSLFSNRIRNRFRLSNNIPLILFISYFLISALSLLYTTHINDGFLKIQTKLSFVLIPLGIIFSSLNLDAGFRKKVLNYFVIFTVVAGLAALLNALIHSMEMGSFSKVVNDDGNMIKQYYFTYTHLAFFIMHPAYFSIYTVSAIFSAVYLFYRQESLFNQFWQLAILVFLLIFLFLLQGRMSILAFALISGIGIIWYIFKQGSWTRALLISAAGIVVIFGIYWLAPETLLRRFTEFGSLEYDLSARSVYAFNGITIRLAEWECALAAISDQWLWGYGLGDGYHALQNAYIEKNFLLGIRDNYNAHNQFLETSLQTGLTGLISLLAIFIYAIYNALRYKDVLLLLLSGFLLISMLTESILERQWAIGFFCSFYALLLMNTKRVTTSTQSAEI